MMMIPIGGLFTTNCSTARLVSIFARDELRLSLETMHFFIVAATVGVAGGGGQLAARQAGQRCAVRLYEPGDESSFSTRFGEKAYSTVTGVAKALSSQGTSDKLPVELAMARLQRDLGMLDQAASAKTSISPSSVFVLSATVLVAATAPFAFGEKLVEVLVPSMSAISAAIGLSAEYNGKVEVARGKEIAAVTLQVRATNAAMPLARQS